MQGCATSAPPRVPWASLQSMGDDIWEKDNVHLTPAGYENVASLVMSVSKEMIEKNMMALEVSTSKRPREDQD